MIAIVAVYGHDDYRRYATALLRSLATIDPRPERVVIVHGHDFDRIAWPTVPNTTIDPIAIPSDYDPAYTDEHRVRRVAVKVGVWSYGILRACRNGDRVVCLDADTLVIQSLEPAFRSHFDVAYTVRTGRWPLNSGVVFLRMTTRTTQWLTDWCAQTQWILDDPNRIQLAIDRYGAPDQAALAASIALHRGYDGLTTINLSSAIWNCDDRPADPSARILHVKGLLPACRGLAPIPDGTEDIVARWRAVGDFQ